ncbi:uncharacterized protein BDV17DRAFT_41177 [Aspergillus undulatus]|uniref:uncharacterized protein n=1 Tax=Aspergillus undulatus TaxID=1810928 RepID=UPI003CCCEE90
MKNSAPISSDIWEEKRALIAALYKDEEWPLKQVIKKIRSENFNPSETQLRSRLKKWRVTKPSRQTRKKSEEATSNIRESNSPRRRSNNSPKVLSRIRPPTTTELPATEPEWYTTNRAYEPHGLPVMPLGGQDIPTVWAPASGHSSPLSSPGKSRVSSHASLSVSTSNLCDSSQSSPLVDGALLNPTSSMTPAFAHPSYGLDADSCIQAPASTTTPVPLHWAIPQYYSIPVETSQGPGMPFYTTAPLTPPIDPLMHMVPPQASQQVTEFHNGLNNLKRNLSSPYEPEFAQKARQQPKPFGRKVPLPSKINTGQYPAAVSTPTSPFYTGQYPSMCSPNYAYLGPESLVHRSSVEF